MIIVVLFMYRSGMMNWLRWHRDIQKDVCLHTILLEPVKLHHSGVSVKTLLYHPVLVTTMRAYLCCGIMNAVTTTLLLLSVLVYAVIIHR